MCKFIYVLIFNLRLYCRGDAILYSVPVEHPSIHHVPDALAQELLLVP